MNPKAPLLPSQIPHGILGAGSLAGGTQKGGPTQPGRSHGAEEDVHWGQEAGEAPQEQEDSLVGRQVLSASVSPSVKWEDDSPCLKLWLGGESEVTHAQCVRARRPAAQDGVREEAREAGRVLRVLCGWLHSSDPGCFTFLLCPGVLCWPAGTSRRRQGNY